jgi:uridylate kinase
MSVELRFQRVLLKMSGEVLKGTEPFGIQPDAVVAAAQRVKQLVDLGTEVALVIGAGNIFRGQAASRQGMDRSCADQMGMLATMMNALAMRDALESVGAPAEILSALPVPGLVQGFDYRVADRLLGEGKVVLFAAGTGHPYFTTDTTAALRACEIRANAVLKGTQVDGIYTADPKTNPDAERFTSISYSEALSRRLKVMDSTAFSLCMDNDIPIVVFNFSHDGVLTDVVKGDLSQATLVCSDPT